MNRFFCYKIFHLKMYQLPFCGFSKITHVSLAENGKPLANKKYVIYLLNGDKIKGTTDESGVVLQTDLKIGEYYIEFKE